MVPVAFGACHGWFHPPRGAALDRGVVLCSPFGYEALGTWRGWRALAEALAAEGLPALRFDYPGTGDAAGDDGTPRVADWIDAVDLAAGWLRRQAGVQQLALCGLRLGALLAAAAAARRPGDAETLILLAPPASGRAYVRELTVAASASPAGRDGLEIAGFPLSDADCDAIAALDLAATVATARARRVLLAAPFRSPARPDGAAVRLAAAGVSFDRMPFQGRDAWLRPAHESLTPQADFRAIARWAAVRAPRRRRPFAVPSAMAGLRLPMAAEQLLRFGPGNALAGVLCEPATRQEAAPALLILNAGAVPRSGNGRFAVRLARHLAGLGVVSLRMDAHGIGDSDGPDAAGQNLEDALFGEGVLRDAAAAVNALAGRGVRDCFVVGVCSGAHHAFRVALDDSRIVGLALANLPAFDRSVGGAPAFDGGPPPGEHPWLRKPRMLVRRVVSEMDRVLTDRFGLQHGPDRARSWVRQLQRRGVTLLLAYSASDRSLRELRAHFGRGGRTLPRQVPPRCVVLSGSDHSLTPRRMQDEFIALIEEQLRLFHGLGDRPVEPIAAPAPVPAFQDTAA